MKKNITVFLLLLAFFTQDHKLVSEQPKSSEIKTFEKQFGSKQISGSSGVSYSVSPDLCPAAKKYELAQPMRFARPGNDLPPFVVAYYYSKSDSLVRCITYTVVTPNDGSFDKFGMPFYEEIFSTIVVELEKELGAPEKLDKEFKMKENFMGMKFYQKEVLWEQGDMTVKGSLGKAQNRIRFTQRWD